MLYDLVGFTGSGLAHLNWRPFDENVPERIARLVHDKKMGPAIVVFPDCFTCLGGNQYVNSAAIGRYADYLTQEIVPFVDREFRTLASRDHRGCFGKSSGGYGAIVHGMRYAKHWGAIADHSGDAYFDFCYLTDWPRTLNELDRFRRRPRASGRIDVLRDQKGADLGRGRRSRQALPRGGVVEGEAERRRSARADDDRDGGDLRRGSESAARLPPAGQPRDRRAHRKRWRAWLAHDPIHMVAKHKAALASLHGVWIDCGWRDQYHLHYGARILSKRLAASTASSTSTRSSTTIIRRSTTGWTRACRSSTRR